MSSRGNILNRVVLALLGVLLVIAGGLGLARGLGAFGTQQKASPVLLDEVRTFPDGRPWFWWAVTGALLLVAVLSLLWLITQLTTDRTSRLDLTTNARDGYTSLHAGALTDAVENEALGITGVTSASAGVWEHRGERVFLRVGLAEAADIAEVRARLEDEVVAHLREGVGDSNLPVTIELHPDPAKNAQRALV